MKPNPFARLFAVLGFAALVGALLFSRDNKLSHRVTPPSQAAPDSQLYSSIESLADAPAPAPQAAPAKADAQPETKPESKP